MTSIDELNERLDGGMLVYQFYISESIRLKKPILSPLREERTPSFFIFKKEGNTIWFKDFGGSGSGNHWTFVQELFGCTFKEAIAKVKADILGERIAGFSSEAYKPYIKQKPLLEVECEEPVQLTPMERPWMKEDFQLFEPFKISKPTMEAFHMAPLLGFRYEKGDRKFTIHDSPDSPMYGFRFLSGRCKIYRPKEKKFKWTSNLVAAEDVFGYDLLPPKAEKVFLLAGNKDTMSFYENIGLPCIALASESSNMTEELYRILVSICPERKFYSLYDNDEAGYKNAEKLQEKWGIKPLNKMLDWHGEKDFADLVRSRPDLVPGIRKFLRGEL